MKYTREVKTVVNSTLEQVVQCWNEAFHDPAVYMTEAQLRLRMAREDILADASFTLYEGERLAGAAFNAYRRINGQLSAWHGGVVVDPSMQRQGIAKALMKHTMAAYEMQGVQLATLEVPTTNDVAMHIYTTFGYEAVDKLFYFTGEAVMDAPVLEQRAVRTDLLKYVHFYEPLVPWKCQVESLKEAEALIFYDWAHDPVGYIVFKRIYDGEQQQSVEIYQLKLFVEDVDVLNRMVQVAAGAGGRFMTIDLVASSTAAKLFEQQQTTVARTKWWLHKKMAPSHKA